MASFIGERCFSECLDPEKPHDVRFKPERLDVAAAFDVVKFHIEKPRCTICGATEETEICNRTFYDD